MTFILDAIGELLAWVSRLFIGPAPKKPEPSPLDIEDALERDAKADYEQAQIKKDTEAALAEPPKPPEEMNAELEAFRKRRGR